MSDEFHKQLVEGFRKEKSWSKIITMLKELSKRLKEEAISPTRSPTGTRSLIPTGIDFEMRDDLIYHVRGDKLRLCIPTSVEKEVFAMAHDSNQHSGYHRTFQRIVDTLYIPKLSRKLRKYVEHCPTCQLNQIKRHSPYGELMPISTHARPFHTITMDYIVGLPEMEGCDTMLTLSCGRPSSVD